MYIIESTGGLCTYFKRFSLILIKLEFRENTAMIATYYTNLLSFLKDQRLTRNSFLGQEF